MSLKILQDTLMQGCSQIDEFIIQKGGFDLDLDDKCIAIRDTIIDIPMWMAAVGILVLVLLTVYAVLKQANYRYLVFNSKLLEIKVVTHDTKIFTFSLPQGINKIGLNIGEHLLLSAEIDGKVEQRQYTPISRPDLKRNSFLLLIKIYATGKMSSYVNRMKIGDKIKVSLPYGKFNYLGNKEVQVKDGKNKTTRHKYDNFYLVGGGTGITPLYQIIQYVTEVQFPQNTGPNITLLFANRTENDILLKGQIQDFQNSNPNFKCYFSVDKTQKEGWTGFTGFINQEKIQDTIPKDISNTFFGACGPPPMVNLVEKLLVDKFKVKRERFFRF